MRAFWCWPNNRLIKVLLPGLNFVACPNWSLLLQELLGRLQQPLHAIIISVDLISDADIYAFKGRISARRRELTLQNEQLWNRVDGMKFHSTNLIASKCVCLFCYLKSTRENKPIWLQNYKNILKHNLNNNKFCGFAQMLYSIFKSHFFLQILWD